MMSILKKVSLLAAICAVVSMIHFQTAFAAYPDYVAVISNYKDVKDRITIQRASGPASGSQSLLYPDDKITGDVKYVRIESGPYADFHNINDEYYLISYNPPSAFEKFVNDVCELTQIFWIRLNNILIANGEPPLDAKTRGSESDLNPRPGFDVTLINNQKVLFAGVSKTEGKKVITPKSYVIKDSRGQEIYSSSFDKNGKAELDLSSQNFQVGEKYTWAVDSTEEYDFIILDEETAQMIRNRFSEIDAKKISPEKRTLEKAFWAQQISDTSDDKINLYWLSAQLLDEISPKSKDVELSRNIMLQKYRSHLKDEFAVWLRGGN